MLRDASRAISDKLFRMSGSGLDIVADTRGPIWLKTYDLL
jgi:hypothetical protein